MERSQGGEREGKVAVMGLQQQLECFSDDIESRDDGGAEAGRKEMRGEPGESVAVAKRRRGRPPGSKNKPKPPVVVTREAPEPAAAMRPHVLEIPGGGDVTGALAGFARRRGLGICVLAGTGAVTNVSLRHPLPSEAEISGAAVVVFHGRYEILSISATFLPPAMSAAAPRALGGLSISLAGPHGQIVGGAVAGPLVAATTVVVVAAAFTCPTFHRLPAEDDAPASVSGSGAEADEHRGRQTEPQEHHHLTLQPHSMAPATTTQPVFASACQHEEVWAPAAATAPRPRPPYQ
ncbi:hypothetical protein E2562_009742 [Oryza meyeriana var. granulata]|uniref:PPC domain-containing protein n=1 Tax=Oryza meyeriana var. granulata TaxID=110450 RepID=A0A6G1D114_9ORYZ|nr:hypothetical protein E2562_009742 [Oryza meyeriana var. granulata]